MRGIKKPKQLKRNHPALHRFKKIKRNAEVDAATLMGVRVERTGKNNIRFDFPNGLWIEGTEWADESLTISDMYYNNNRYQGNGYGRTALKQLRTVYSDIFASQVVDAAIPFWEKMMKEGHVRSIVSYYSDC